MTMMLFEWHPWKTFQIKMSCLIALQQVAWLPREEQGGITCGAIDEPTKSSKAIDERVIINFRDKNVVIARFRDKNGGFIDSHSDQSIAIFFYR